MKATRIPRALSRTSARRNGWDLRPDNASDASPHTVPSPLLVPAEHGLTAHIHRARFFHGIGIHCRRLEAGGDLPLLRHLPLADCLMARRLAVLSMSRCGRRNVADELSTMRGFLSALVEVGISPIRIFVLTFRHQ